MNQEAKTSCATTSPVEENLLILEDNLNRAHNLYSRLQDKISIAICSAPPLQCNNKDGANPSYSELVTRIKSLTRRVEDLCIKIETDVDTIQL